MQLPTWTSTIKTIPSSALRLLNLRVAGKWLVLGVAVGVVTGAAAILFNLGLHGLSELIWEQGLLADRESVNSRPLPWVLTLGLPLIPALGGLLCGLLVWRFAAEAQGHGTDVAIRAFHQQRGVLRARLPLVKGVASILTMASGGSAGREGPIALIGGAIGSALATRLGLGTSTRRVLLVAGMAAGVGAIFRAPIAGAIFAAEVLYSEMEIEGSALLPAIIAAVTSYSVYGLAFGYEQVVPIPAVYRITSAVELVPLTVLALVVTLGSWLYVRVFYGLRAWFSALPLHQALRPAAGGLLAGLIALLLLALVGDRHVLSVLGVGYEVLHAAVLEGPTALGAAVLLTVALGKILTTASSVGSGGSGGVFGPAIVIGACLGGATGQALALVWPDAVPHPGLYTVVGMAGFFAAASNTPLSTVIMASELTGNYQLLVPSIWVCALAFLLSRRWTIFHSQVPSPLQSPAHFGEGAEQVFRQATVGDLFRRTRRFVLVPETWLVADLLKAIKSSNIHQRLFPLVDEAGLLTGQFRLDDLNELLRAHADAPRLNVGVLRHPLVYVLRQDDDALTAVRGLSSLAVEEMLVVAADDQRRPLGLLTAADILVGYNRRLAEEHATGHGGPAPAG